MNKINYEINICEKYIDIKYYNKIIDIKDDYISILFNNKKIIIIGSGLIINKLDKYELTIIGNYDRIEFIDE